MTTSITHLNLQVVQQAREEMLNIKKDNRKKYYLTVDVETACGFDNPAVYDLGFAVHDKKGNILFERSFLINEIFNNEQIMHTAYYKEKVPMYRQQLAEGLHTLTTFELAREVFLSAIAYFGVTTIMAYNLKFDMNALQKSSKRLLNENKFTDVRAKDVELKDIWSYACEVLFSQKSFPKFAFENGMYSEAGNYRTSAEVAYAYMKRKPNFVEEHTGLADVRIEVEIFAKCEAQKKKHEAGILNHPWRLVTNTHGKIVLEKNEQ